MHVLWTCANQAIVDGECTIRKVVALVTDYMPCVDAILDGASPHRHHVHGLLATCEGLAHTCCPGRCFATLVPCSSASGDLGGTCVHLPSRTVVLCPFSTISSYTVCMLINIVTAFLYQVLLINAPPSAQPQVWWLLDQTNILGRLAGKSQNNCQAWYTWPSCKAPSHLRWLKTSLNAGCW